MSMRIPWVLGLPARLLRSYAAIAREQRRRERAGLCIMCDSPADGRYCQEHYLDYLAAP